MSVQVIEKQTDETKTIGYCFNRSLPILRHCTFDLNTALRTTKIFVKISFVFKFETRIACYINEKRVGLSEDKEMVFLADIEKGDVLALSPWEGEHGLAYHVNKMTMVIMSDNTVFSACCPK